MKKVLEILFVLSFFLTGCGVDSIFQSREDLFTWIVAAAVTVLCAIAIGGDPDEKEED